MNCSLWFASVLCVWFAFVVVCCSSTIIAATEVHDEKVHIYQKIAEFSRNNCQGGVFLDFGSNTGVQLCRFCDPAFFPGSRLKNRFDQVFGVNRTDACIISFEPNPAHIDTIHKASEYCRKSFNIPVLQLSRVALWEMDGNMTFYLSLNQTVQEGASLFMRTRYVDPLVNNVQVHTLSVPRIFRVLRHHLPKPTPIFVKMDIEGAEFEVIRALIHTGTLCYPTSYEIEYHRKIHPGLPDLIGNFMRFVGDTRSCNTTINPLDDETGLNMNLAEYLNKV